jgi:regulator of nucleoside diphosphate kinase
LILPDISAQASHEPDPDAVPVLVSRDYSRLRALARLWCHPDDPVGRTLTDTLDRCRVLPPDAVPPAIAVLGAQVVFATEVGIPETCILVMPEDDAQDGSTLAVSTPFGAALLGVAAGQAVEAIGPDARPVTLRLLAVCHRLGRGSAGAMLQDRQPPGGTLCAGTNAIARPEHEPQASTENAHA